MSITSWKCCFVLNRLSWNRRLVTEYQLSILWTDKSQFKPVKSNPWVDCRKAKEKWAPETFRAQLHRCGLIMTERHARTHNFLGCKTHSKWNIISVFSYHAALWRSNKWMFLIIELFFLEEQKEEKHQCDSKQMSNNSILTKYVVTVFSLFKTVLAKYFF